MARLIDADALQQHFTDMQHYERCACNFTDDGGEPATEWYCVENALENAHTIDAIPVVRCRDCKYSDTFADTTTATTPLKCLNIRYGGVYPDWYCEHGERREAR